jgi:hypothetical protein
MQQNKFFISLINLLNNSKNNFSWEKINPNPSYFFLIISLIIITFYLAFKNYNNIKIFFSEIKIKDYFFLTGFIFFFAFYSLISTPIYHQSWPDELFYGEMARNQIMYNQNGHCMHTSIDEYECVGSKPFYGFATISFLSYLIFGINNFNLILANYIISIIILISLFFFCFLITKNKFISFATIFFLATQRTYITWALRGESNPCALLFLIISLFYLIIHKKSLEKNENNNLDFLYISIFSYIICILTRPNLLLLLPIFIFILFYKNKHKNILLNHLKKNKEKSLKKIIFSSIAIISFIFFVIPSFILTISYGKNTINNFSFLTLVSNSNEYLFHYVPSHVLSISSIILFFIGAFFTILKIIDSIKRSKSINFNQIIKICFFLILIIIYITSTSRSYFDNRSRYHYTFFWIVFLYSSIGLLFIYKKIKQIKINEIIKLIIIILLFSVIIFDSFYLNRDSNWERRITLDEPQKYFYSYFPKYINNKWDYENTLILSNYYDSVLLQASTKYKILDLWKFKELNYDEIEKLKEFNKIYFINGSLDKTFKYDNLFVNFDKLIIDYNLSYNKIENIVSNDNNTSIQIYEIVIN